MTKQKRDIYDGAVPADDYYTSNVTQPKLKLSHFTKSQAHYNVQVPKADIRHVREQVIQSEIIELLRDSGAWVHKAKAVNLVGDGILAPTQQGVPDILACYRGRFIAIEVKAASKRAKVSGEQAAQIAMIIECEGVAAVCWSTAQVEAILQSIDNSIDG